MAFTAIYDACVLYPFTLRDVLIELALTDLFAARWTERILDECFESLLEKNPHLKPSDLERTRSLMNRHVRDALIADYEGLIDSLTLPDPKDRHVLAAAIVGHADVIVTYNLKDFPRAELEEYHLEAQHPDDFITDLMDLDAEAVAEAVERCRQRCKTPSFEREEYFAKLEAFEPTQTAKMLRVHFAEMGNVP